MHASHRGDTVNQWLHSLGSSGNDLSLDSQGNCFLVADNEIGVVVSCPEGSQQLAVLSPLVPVPVPLSARMYEELLALNLSLEFTAGTHIYFDKNTRALGLAVSRDIGSLDELAFRNLLTNFKSKAAEVKGFLDALLYGEPLAGAASQFSSARQAWQHGAGHPQEGA